MAGVDAGVVVDDIPRVQDGRSQQGNDDTTIMCQVCRPIVDLVSNLGRNIPYTHGSVDQTGIVICFQRELASRGS